MNMIKKLNIKISIILIVFFSNTIISFQADSAPICSLTQTTRQPSLFSFPVTKMTQSVDFEADVLSRRRHYNTCPLVCERYGTWAQAFFGHVNQGSQGCEPPDTCDPNPQICSLQPAYDASGRGLIIGVDRRWNPNFRGGFAYAFSREKATSGSESESVLENSLQINSQQGLIYGRYQLCDIYCSATASFALNLYKQNQDVSLDEIDDFTGWQFNGKLEAGYQFNRACGSFIYHATPYALFNYGHLSTHAYQRDNGMSVHNEPVDSAQLGVGLLLSYDYRRDNLVSANDYLQKLNPRFNKGLCDMNLAFYNALLRLKWQYTPYLRLTLTKDVLKEDQETFVHLGGQEDSGCVFTNAAPFDHGYIVGLGVALDFKNNNFLSLEYDYESKSKFNLQAAFIKYRLEWC